jgi:phosphoesterase RecJ-like protein
MHVTQDMMERCEATEEDCEGLVNYALAIGGIEVALFFRELPTGDFRVSLRSKGNVNVAAVAESFGGGGHECASGCAVKGPLTNALDEMLGQFRVRGYDLKVH